MTPPSRDLIDPASGSPSRVDIGQAPVLVGRRVDDEGVRGVLGYICNPCVIIDIQCLCPSPAAVDGPEYAPVRVGPPEMAHGGDEDDIGVSPIDEDAGDVPRLPKAHVRPGLPRVGRLVDAVADRDAVPAGGLPRPYPDDGRVGRGDGDVPDGDGRFLEEDRKPRRAVVFGLPDPAGADGRVDGPRAALGDVDVHRPASHDGGPERAPKELFEQPGHPVGALPGRRDGRDKGHGGCQQERGREPAMERGRPERRHGGLLDRRFARTCFFII